VILLLCHTLSLPLEKNQRRIRASARFAQPPIPRLSGPVNRNTHSRRSSLAWDSVHHINLQNAQATMIENDVGIGIPRRIHRRVLAFRSRTSKSQGFSIISPVSIRRGCAARGEIRSNFFHINTREQLLLPLLVSCDSSMRTLPPRPVDAPRTYTSICCRGTGPEPQIAPVISPHQRMYHTLPGVHPFLPIKTSSAAHPRPTSLALHPCAIDHGLCFAAVSLLPLGARLALLCTHAHVPGYLVTHAASTRQSTSHE